MLTYNRPEYDDVCSKTRWCYARWIPRCNICWWTTKSSICHIQSFLLLSGINDVIRNEWRSDYDDIHSKTRYIEQTLCCWFPKWDVIIICADNKHHLRNLKLHIDSFPSHWQLSFMKNKPPLYLHSLQISTWRFTFYYSYFYFLITRCKR